MDDMCDTPMEQVRSQRKTWVQLAQAVHKSRSLQLKFVNQVPHQFNFYQDRLYFLGVAKGQRENTLFYVELQGGVVPEQENEHSPGLAPWNQLLRHGKISPFTGFSREEELLRERKRQGSFGITSYELHKENGRFLFPASRSLYSVTLPRQIPPQPQVTAEQMQLEENGSQAPDVDDDDKYLCPVELTTHTTEARMDASLCPSNDDLYAFVHRNDLWIGQISTGEEKRLTFTTGDGTHVEEPVSAGVPSFVVQEEFDRYTGYWWQPCSSCENGEIQKYRILYEEVDESSVEILQIVSSPCGLKHSSVDSYRYPRAGSANAQSKLKMVEFTLGKDSFVDNLQYLDLSVPLNHCLPWMEYLVRAGWLPDGKSIWAQVLDRSQQRLVLVQIPVQLFTNVSTEGLLNHSLVEFTPSHKITVLIEEQSDIWINVHNIIHFLSSSNKNRIEFIWGSECTGFLHLYHVTVDTATSCDMLQDSLVSPQHIRHPAAQRRQLTSGDWVVLNHQVKVDESRKLVYFMGSKETPVEQHLYCVSYTDPTSGLTLLTWPGYNHTVTMNKECTKFVTEYSSVSHASSVRVCDLLFSHLDSGAFQVSVQQSLSLLECPEIGHDYVPPELFNFKNKEGHQLYGFLFKPDDIQPGQKYPTVLFVYGGPDVQIVTNSHKGSRFLRLHTLARLGYVVVAVDGRGSFNRGLAFESYLKNHLGSVELTDQVEALEYLIQTVDFIDRSRIAIHGWSYGGYLSLLGLQHRPDLFKVAIAGAPVTAWEAYDTGYTERYLGTPQENFLGYSLSSVLGNVHSFPDQENRLLIVHGLIDENVHFHHTTLLINQLVKACKPYQLQIYPSERHGIRQAEATDHYETNLLSFLEQHL